MHVYKDGRPQWLAAVSVLNPTSSVLIDGTWTKLKSPSIRQSGCSQKCDCRSLTLMFVQMLLFFPMTLLLFTIWCYKNRQQVRIGWHVIGQVGPRYHASSPPCCNYEDSKCTGCQYSNLRYISYISGLGEDVGTGGPSLCTIYGPD